MFAILACQLFPYINSNLIKMHGKMFATEAGSRLHWNQFDFEYRCQYSPIRIIYNTLAEQWNDVM